MVVKKKLTNKIIIKNRSDLIDHSYFLALGFEKIDGQSENLAKWAKVMNIYDNRVEEKYTWEQNTPWNWRVLEDIT